MLIKQTKKLPETIKTIWRLKELIAIVVAAIIAGGLFWWQRSTTGVLSLWLFWIAVSILGLTVLSSGVVLLLIPYRWNFWTYYLDERQIALHHGYFFRKQVIVPIARVQNVTLKQGPLLRLKSLQKVVIQTAAGSHEIDGLEMTQAEALKDQIMALAQEAKNDL